MKSRSVKKVRNTNNRRTKLRRKQMKGGGKGEHAGNGHGGQKETEYVISPVSPAVTSQYAVASEFKASYNDPRPLTTSEIDYRALNELAFNQNEITSFLNLLKPVNKEDKDLSKLQLFDNIKTYKTLKNNDYLIHFHNKNGLNDKLKKLITDTIRHQNLLDYISLYTADNTNDFTSLKQEGSYYFVTENIENNDFKPANLQDYLTVISNLHYHGLLLLNYDEKNFVKIGNKIKFVFTNDSFFMYAQNTVDQEQNLGGICIDNIPDLIKENVRDKIPTFSKNPCEINLGNSNKEIIEDPDISKSIEFFMYIDLYIFNQKIYTSESNNEQIYDQATVSIKLGDQNKYKLITVDDITLNTVKEYFE